MRTHSSALQCRMRTHFNITQRWSNSIQRSHFRRKYCRQCYDFKSDHLHRLISVHLLDLCTTALQIGRMPQMQKRIFFYLSIKRCAGYFLWAKLRVCRKSTHLYRLQRKTEDKNGRRRNRRNSYCHRLSRKIYLPLRILRKDQDKDHQALLQTSPVSKEAIRKKREEQNDDLYFG